MKKRLLSTKTGAFSLIPSDSLFQDLADGFF